MEKIVCIYIVKMTWFSYHELRVAGVGACE